MRRVWVPKGACQVAERQTKYEWNYFFGSLEVTEGHAHFAHLQTMNLNCDPLYLEELAASDPDALHVVIRDNARFQLRDGDARLPAARVRILPTAAALQSGAQSVRAGLGRNQR